MQKETADPEAIKKAEAEMNEAVEQITDLAAESQSFGGTMGLNDYLASGPYPFVSSSAIGGFAAGDNPMQVVMQRHATVLQIATKLLTVKKAKTPAQAVNLANDLLRATDQVMTADLKKAKDALMKLLKKQKEVAEKRNALMKQMQSLRPNDGLPPFAMR